MTSMGVAKPGPPRPCQGPPCAQGPPPWVCPRGPQPPPSWCLGSSGARPQPRQAPLCCVLRPAPQGPRSVPRLSDHLSLGTLLGPAVWDYENARKRAMPSPHPRIQAIPACSSPGPLSPDLATHAEAFSNTTQLSLCLQWRSPLLPGGGPKSWQQDPPLLLPGLSTGLGLRLAAPPGS